MNRIHWTPLQRPKSSKFEVVTDAPFTANVGREKQKYYYVFH